MISKNTMDKESLSIWLGKCDVGDIPSDKEIDIIQPGSSAQDLIFGCTQQHIKGWKWSKQEKKNWRTDEIENPEVIVDYNNQINAVTKLT